MVYQTIALWPTKTSFYSVIPENISTQYKNILLSNRVRGMIFLQSVSTNNLFDMMKTSVSR